MAMDDDMQTFRRNVVTNGDKIRAMNNWDLAKYLYGYQCNALMMGVAADVDGIFDYLENEVQHG
jgi:hypothetical protein